MSLKTITAITVTAILGGSVTTFAAEQHSSHSEHAKPTVNMSTPSEAGQSAFAAIAEIVSILEADPNTNWSEVNVQALRDHLVDMNELTLKADVELEINDKTLTFIVTGQGVTVDAIQSMVPAHAIELDKMEAWSTSTNRQTDGVRLVIQAASEKEKVKILGLGFFGLMATGAHHQPHHFGIATGQMTH